MNRELKPWEWAECDKDGNYVAIFDARLKLPIYDNTSEEEAKKIKAWADKLPPLTAEELKGIYGG